MPTLSKRSRTHDILKGIQAFPPEGLREPFKAVPIEWTQRFPFGVDGENKSVPADALEPGQAVLIQDYKINLGDIELAWGYTGLGSPKGTPKEILNLNNYKTLQGDAFLVRIDEDELMYWEGSSWTDVAGASGKAMSGDQDDPIRSAMILDKFVFVNGVDDPRIWSGGATYTELTTDTNVAPRPRFLVSFADRAVFADIGTGATRDTQRIEWSASGLITDYTATGAGGVSLVDSQGTNPADDIMGLAVQNNFLIVVRRHSIWVGLRTGDANLPIQFNSRVQGFGAIAAGSVLDCGAAGVLFLGHDNVYLYNPNQAEPIPIGTTIRDRIFNDIIDMSKLDRVHAAFVPSTREAWLFIPDSTNAWPRRAFVLNLERFTTTDTFVWSERVFPEDISASLGGQSSGLGATAFAESEKKLITAGTDGDAFDSDSADTTNDGAAFTAEFESAQFTAGNNFVQLLRVNLAYTAASDSTITLDFSIDGGDNWTNSANFVLPASTNVSEASLWVPAGVFGRAIQFRVRATGAQSLSLVGYRVGFLERGPIRGL